MIEPEPEGEAERWKNRFERERLARVEAERITEKGLRELYERQQRLDLLRSVADAANEAETTNDAVSKVLGLICRFADFDLAHLWRVAPGSTELQATKCWYERPGREGLLPFIEVTNEAVISSVAGLPCQIRNAKVSMWVQDVRKEPGCSRHEAAGRAGILSAFGFPVMCGSHVHAVFEFYSQKSQRPDEDLLGLCDQFGKIMGRVFDRDTFNRAIMTANEQLEERVVARTRELERTARLKDEFLASVSHELRTPLNAILGFSEILLAGVHGDLNDGQRKSIRSIESGGQHLLSLINDILDLSKLGSGVTELDIEPVEIREVCRAAIALVTELARRKNQTLDVEFNCRREGIEADPRRLKQILVNLLSNAIKFTPKGGRVELNVLDEDEWIRFDVRDNGIGIAADKHADLFKPFVQIDSKLSREYGGTGLGLALVSQLAELHGGGVAVESEAGRGSRFSVRLPGEAAHTVFLAREDLEADEVEELSEETNTKRVLVVDDNVANREVLATYLEAKGFSIDTAEDGPEGVEMALRNPPDLVLMDIMMPKMNGLEAIKKLRATTTTAEIPIVALTSMAMAGDREECLKAGANEYLSKPVRLKMLAAVLEDLLDS